MDPLSLSLGIAGVMPLLAKVIQSAYEYLSAVNGAKESINALIFELETLQTSVRSLVNILRDESTGNNDFEFAQTSVLVSCSQACERKLQSLCRKLNQDTPGKINRYLWPFTEKEYQKTIQELRNFTSWIQFGLSIDGRRLLSRTSDDVLRLLDQQLRQFDMTESLEQKTTQIYDAVVEQGNLVRNNAEAEFRRKILDWISTAKHTQKHHLLRQSRARNTGSWLLQQPEYMAWLDKTSSHNVLWCWGIQGSGKTHLASIVIDELLSKRTSSNNPLAFFYFDHQDHDSQTPFTVSSGMLRQLLEMLPDVPSSVAEAYNGHKDGPLPIEECGELMTQVITSSICTYIIIDALDECDSLRHLNGVLQLIRQLSAISSCRLLVTSRPHIHDLASALGEYPQIMITAHEDDIRSYISQELESRLIRDTMNVPFKELLTEKLVQNSRGMFLLAVLQLRAILLEPSLGEMEDKLEELADSLVIAFEDTISRIQRLPKSRSSLAMTALMYLVHVKRPLSVDELSDVLAIQRPCNSIMVPYRPSARVIIECCQGLAMVDPDTGQFRVSHYAIHEYLSENSPKLFPAAEKKLTLDCLRYIMMDDFKTGPCHTESEILSRIHEYPFLPYASQFWGHHAQMCETDSDVWNALLAFFAAPNASATAVQAWRFSAGFHQGYYNALECSSFTPLHYAAQRGLEKSVRMLLDKGTYDINERTSMGATAIIQAAAGGHVPVVQFLLDRGADPRLSNQYGDALQCAAENGKSETIKQLVAWGMDPNRTPGIGGIGSSPLSCTLDRDAAAAFDTLVELGATIHSDLESDDELLFHLAFSIGCEKIVALMLRRGWVDIRSRDAVAGLRHAIEANQNSVVRVMIKAGADVNAVTRSGHSLLEWARSNGNHVAARLLLEAGGVSKQ